ncbi:unnamed protein product [Bathycoccus prasinos]
MDDEDFNFDWEGLECDILRSILRDVLKNMFEPCATNEVTNLGIFGKKTMHYELGLAKNHRETILRTKILSQVQFPTRFSPNPNS